MCMVLSKCICCVEFFVGQHLYTIWHWFKLYRQVVGIPTGTNSATLVADLFLFRHERNFTMVLSDDKQADIIEDFNATSRYLDDILNMNNISFDNMVRKIYNAELQLDKYLWYWNLLLWLAFVHFQWYWFYQKLWLMWGFWFENVNFPMWHILQWSRRVFMVYIESHICYHWNLKAHWQN